MPLQGHIRGAIDLPYTDFLIMNDQKEDVNNDGKIDSKDASYKFTSPAASEKIFKASGYKDGDELITYCRSGRKATVVNLVADMLNYSPKMYDGSWVQWGEMAGGRTDINGTEILPKGSYMDLDNPKYTVVTKRIDPEYTQPSSIYNINLDATTSTRITEEDIAYMKK
jgi:hypothetical protein